MPIVENDDIIGLQLQTQHVRDIAPVRAFTKLRSIDCCGDFNDFNKQGQLVDLSPLRGLPLTNARIMSSPVSDLTPLQGMALTDINIERTQVSDLTPLKGMPLKNLNIYSTPVSDLTPLKGAALESLQATATQVEDLSPLKGMPIKALQCVGSRVSDLSPLKGMPLQMLLCDRTAVSDLTPLKGMPLRMLGCGNTPVSDLSPLKGMLLDDINFGNTQVLDFSPLKGMPLKILTCDFKAQRDATILRDITTLENINSKPAAEFWQEVAGQTKADRKAAEYALSIGGMVQVNEQDRKLDNVADLPREPFRLTTVDLHSNQQVSDAGLANFKDCKNLTRLVLNKTKVSDAGLANFKNCKELTYLDLGGNDRVSDVGLAHFAGCKNLAVLVLWQTQVRDKGLAYFKDCKNMTKIWLDSTKVSDAGLKNLTAMTKLEELYLNNEAPNVTGAGIDELTKALPKCRIEWDAPDHRAADYVLSIGGTVQVNEQDRNLGEEADLRIYPFRLTAVDLKGKQAKDEGLANFRDCRYLKAVHLQKTKVSAKGIEGLKKALPKCKIEWDGGVIEPN